MPEGLTSDMGVDGAAATLVEQGYCIISLAADQAKLAEIAESVSAIFAEAVTASKDDERFKHFTSRVERGSLPITTDADLEAALCRIVAGSPIAGMARQYWLTSRLVYSRNFSMYRYVDPMWKDQKGYSPLHIDGEFLKTRSINVCIPLTSYGFDCPTLELFPGAFRQITEREARGLVSIKPDVLRGHALCFMEKVPHRRAIELKTKPRINVEFRIFPAETAEENPDKGLAPL